MGSMDDTLLWLTAIGSVATALFTAFLWLVAWRTLFGARDQLGLLSKQAAREGRPFVSAEVVPGLHGGGFWDLVVKNYGRTAARNVRFEFESWEPVDPDDHITERLIAYLDAAHMLVPGAHHRVMWRMNEEPHAKRPAAGADARSSLGVEYNDDQGERFTDTFEFNLDVLGPVFPTPTSGPEVPGAGKDLANIERALRTLNVHVGELRR